MIDHDLQYQIYLESQNLPHFELVHTITPQPFKLESPNLNRKCILALSRSLLILDLIGFDLHFHFQSWNLFFLPNLFAPFLYIFSGTRRLQILVRSSLATDGISLGLWLNIRFVVNHRGAFRSIIAFVIHLLTSQDRYFLWITAVPMPRRCLQSPTTFGIAYATCYTRAERATQSAARVGSSLFDFLTVPSTHCVQKNCIYLQSDLSCL